MKIKVKKTQTGGILPVKILNEDAGWDLTAATVDFDFKEGIIEYGTGIAIEVPVGYIGIVAPRSGITNKALMLKNSIGIIDPGYTGEIKIRMQKTKDNIQSPDEFYAKGDRVAQFFIIKNENIEFEEVTTFLTTTQRGEKGFGSSDTSWKPNTRTHTSRT